MKISNEQIIQSAKRQSQRIESQMRVEPWQVHRANRPWGIITAAAASLVGFFAGYALHANMSQSQLKESPVAQVVQVKHDTIIRVQTVRDTVWQTRVITKYEKQSMLAEQDETPPEQKACSMLCDEIPYELLAAER